MESSDRKSIIGWSWGVYDFKDDSFQFDVKGNKCFSLPYAGIKLASAANKNEVAIELDHDDIKDE